MNKNPHTYLAVFSGLTVVALFAIVFGFGSIKNDFMATDNNNSSQTGNALAAVLSSLQGQDTSKIDTVKVQDIVVGDGQEVKNGDTIKVDYIGAFLDGTVFDSSIGKSPFSFTLGGGQVIKGWDEGLQGMKVGGKRVIIVPPSLGYGDVDYGPIPANSFLVFEVDLLSVNDN